MLNQRTRDGLRLRSSGLARISLGGLGIGEVVLQPTDKVSHDDDPAVFFGLRRGRALGMGD
jgi:hypothetical protein